MPANMLPYNDQHTVMSTKTIRKRLRSNDKGKNNYKTQNIQNMHESHLNRKRQSAGVDFVI